MPGPLEGVLTRVVESQEEIATMTIVDGNLADQDRLERLLDASKPAHRPGTEGLHYLLATPFRYTPPTWGSRFGSTFEPSLFYGSATIDTALAETAYYRLLLREAASDLPRQIVSRHAAFEAPWRTARGLRLQEPPFDNWRAALVDPIGYGATQALGTALRAEGIEVIEFESARDPDGGADVALFTPSALAATVPSAATEWLCTSTDDAITFRSSTRPARLVSFEAAAFRVEGVLPRPA